jgi:hypothetical protein
LDKTDVLGFEYIHGCNSMDRLPCRIFPGREFSCSFLTSSHNILSEKPGGYTNIVLDSECHKRKSAKKNRRSLTAQDGNKKVGSLEIRYLQGEKKKRMGILMGDKNGKNRILTCHAKV